MLPSHIPSNYHHYPRFRNFPKGLPGRGVILAMENLNICNAWLIYHHHPQTHTPDSRANGRCRTNSHFQGQACFDHKSRSCYGGLHLLSISAFTLCLLFLESVQFWVQLSEHHHCMKNWPRALSAELVSTTVLQVCSDEPIYIAVY